MHIQMMILITHQVDLAVNLAVRERERERGRRGRKDNVMGGAFSTLGMIIG